MAVYCSDGCTEETLDVESTKPALCHRDKNIEIRAGQDQGGWAGSRAEVTKNTAHGNFRVAS